MFSVRCVRCFHHMETDDLDPSCDRCGAAVVLINSELNRVARSHFDDLAPGVWRYRAFLPQVPWDAIITLGEGGTPLLRAERLGSELGLRNLLIKDESRNPTGSFMDRGSTVILSLANERGIKECSCVTTGNLGASLAAYCAKAGMKARIRINPNTDQGKLYQMLAYGAEIEATSLGPGTRNHVGRELRVTARNPFLLEGEKTTGFELVHELGWKSPDVIVVPVGTGGHLSMIWQSIIQLRRAGVLDSSECRLLGVQVEGAAIRSVREGATRVQTLPLAELEESEPYFRDEAARAMAESHGTTVSSTAGQTIDATRLLAKTEGIFAEPSSASVIAALTNALQSDHITRSETVVCVITGAGLKDTKAVSRLARETRRASLGEPYALPTQIGDTKFALLRLLQGRPSYGYELWRRIGSGRSISTASIYQHLLELEEFAMVRRRGSVVSKGRERVLYELTRRGLDFLRITDKLVLPDRRRPGPSR